MEERIERLKTDRVAQAEFFDEYYRKMYKLFRPYFKSNEDAEDAIMESIAQVFSSLDKFRGSDEKDFYCWARGVTKNKVIDRLRWNKCKRFGYDHDNLSELCHIVTPYDIESKVDLKLVKGVINNSMPKKMGRAITMYEFDGLNYDEISEKTGVREGSVRVDVCRARKWLNKNLHEYGKI